MDLQFFTAIAYASIAILVAVLAIYLALTLLGKISKFVVIVIAIAFLLWLLFSNHGFVQMLGGLGDKIPSFAELFGKGA